MKRVLLTLLIGFVSAILPNLTLAQEEIYGENRLIGCPKDGRIFATDPNSLWYRNCGCTSVIQGNRQYWVAEAHFREVAQFTVTRVDGNPSFAVSVAIIPSSGEFTQLPPQPMSPRELGKFLIDFLKISAMLAEKDRGREEASRARERERTIKDCPECQSLCWHLDSSFCMMCVYDCLAREALALP